jgi:hypothetical protein
MQGTAASAAPVGVFHIPAQPPTAPAPQQGAVPPMDASPQQPPEKLANSDILLSSSPMVQHVGAEKARSMNAASDGAGSSYTAAAPHLAAGVPGATKARCGLETHLGTPTSVLMLLLVQKLALLLLNPFMRVLCNRKLQHTCKRFCSEIKCDRQPGHAWWKGRDAQWGADSASTALCFGNRCGGAGISGAGGMRATGVRG